MLKSHVISGHANINMFCVLFCVCFDFQHFLWDEVHSYGMGLSDQQIDRISNPRNYGPYFEVAHNFESITVKGIMSYF